MRSKLFTLSLLCTALFFIKCKEKASKVINVATTAPEMVNTPLGEEAHATLTIEGMTCAVGCAAVIQKNLNETAGIAEATVDFESKTAVVKYDTKILDFDKIVGVVKDTGSAYSVSEIHQTAAH